MRLSPRRAAVSAGGSGVVTPFIATVGGLYYDFDEKSRNLVLREFSAPRFSIASFYGILYTYILKREDLLCKTCPK
jgi:hypothetical protein